MQNAIHGSDSPQAAEREIVIFFGDTVAPEPAPLDLQITFALIKPDAMPKKDEIIEIIKREGFQISKELELKMSPEMAKEFYSEHEGKPFFGTLCNWMSSAPIYALILEKVGAIKEWRALAGPTNSETARSSAPTSIRALYGKDGSENAVHGSDSYNSAQREIKLVFGDSVLDAINSSLASAKSDLKDVHSSRSNLKKTASKSSVPDLKKSGSKLNLIKSASKEILNSITKSASKASLSKSGSKGSLLKMS
jgi:nucleoside diphosphate kinase